jgi:hypothetical protein
VVDVPRPPRLLAPPFPQAALGGRSVLPGHAFAPPRRRRRRHPAAPRPNRRSDTAALRAAATGMRFLPGVNARGSSQEFADGCARSASRRTAPTLRRPAQPAARRGDMRGEARAVGAFTATGHQRRSEHG